MRLKHAFAPLIVLALAGGAWALIRSHIRATALAGSATDRPKPHRAVPPHGGTPIVVGDEAFTIELVREPGSGTLRAYVLDGELEGFVRIAAQQLSLEVEWQGGRKVLALKPVADLATGETAGDTSLFETRTDWLKKAGRFKGVFRNLRIHDQDFPAVAFSFPEGNSRD